MTTCENSLDDGPFFFDEPLKVNERKPYAFRGKLNPGESLVDAVVDIVDDTFLQVDADSPVEIVFQNFGQIAGIKWGVAAQLSLAEQDLGCCAHVWLRFSLEIDATPPLPQTKKLVQIWGVRLGP